MRELNILEVEQVSGGYGNGFMADLKEMLNSSIIGSLTAGVAGAIIGGKNGGTGGGWGFGALGQLVGMIGGGLIGMAAGGVGGAVVGWNATWTLAQGAIVGFINGTLKP
ncbi:colicin V synthesis protein [Serratia proteamaculans]|uniref:Colicin V synthesis protein n=1 Tax=Serratia proteamaculans TaxID=28151 RepID=A0A5Q2VHJ8_SERPR|nr:colicin V synthesis protein [Serratia proteamaculans]QGH63928.1 colicin V synthesis protein [Serratia proteamaculans]